MKIAKLTYQEVVPVSTTVITNKNNKYHNLKHGTKGSNLWEWSASLNVNIFPVIDNSIRLDSDNYVVVPITKDKKLLTDTKGNVLYSITTDEVTSHRKDTLLLWELPIKNFKVVTYTISGDVIELGKGYIGKVRADRKQKIAAPILEITGDATLTWKATTYDNEVYSQTVNYSYNDNSWDINPPKLIKE